MADVTILNINGTDYDIKDTKSRFPQWNADPATGLPVSGEYIGTSVKKITQYLNRLGELAYKDSLTNQEIISFLGYVPVDTEDFQSAITDLQTNFQAGVDAVYNAVVAKGSTPASHSLSDVVTAIGNISTGGLYMTKEIREDGTYYPSDDGVDAYSLVIVSKDVGEPHTVIFYDVDGETILKTQANVPYHGSAFCTALDGKIINSQYFKGWNPSPTNIVRDTYCYPQFGDYIIESGEIEDDWDTICANNGAPYPLGSYKPLIVNNIPTWTIESPGLDYDDMINDKNGNLLSKVRLRGPGSAYCSPIAMHMYKVAEGEDGTSSTWISSGCLKFTTSPWNRQDEPIFSQSRLGFSGVTGPNFGTVAHVDQGWGSSNLKMYMNTYLLDAFPTCLKDTIKQVNKYYTTFSFSPVDTAQGVSIIQPVEKVSLDKIWALSLKELHTLLNDLPITLGEVYEELNGIDYSSIYQPNYRNDGEQQYGEGLVVGLRSAGLWNNNSLRGASISYYDGSNVGLRSVIATMSKSIPFGFCL